jgi:DNA-binding transcriptional ArsR family regulator
MVLKTLSSPFGGLTRTRVLIALRLLGSSYPRELARTLDAPVSGIRKALQSLERDALVAGRNVGRTRVYQLNPTYFARDALQTYLSRLADADPETQRRVSQLRRRPRRTGKPL